MLDPFKYDSVDLSKWGGVYTYREPIQVGKNDMICMSRCERL